MQALYILCDSPVFVRPSIWLGAEGPRDPKSRWETSVATSSYMRSSGTVWQSTRPIAIGAAVEQPGGQRTGCALLF